jgi:GxxExxY protein
MTENDVGSACVSAATAVHRELGPGRLESVYELVRAHELMERGLSADRQILLSIGYRELVFPDVFRADLIVEGKVIIEVKSVEQINNVHRKQLLTYLRLSGMKLRYLFTFGAAPRSSRCGVTTRGRQRGVVGVAPDLAFDFDDALLQLADPGLGLLDELTECATVGLKGGVARYAG